MSFHNSASQAADRAATQTVQSPALELVSPVGISGFTLIEVLVAMLILSLGLLATGQVIFIALSSASTARSQGSAALVAQDKLEFLGDLCRRNPDAAELSVGQHDGGEVQFDGGGGLILNRFAVSWTVSDLGDPRDGVRLHGKMISVRASPVDLTGQRNERVLLNKTVEITSVFHTGTP